jgi:hypothetical protein
MQVGERFRKGAQITRKELHLQWVLKLMSKTSCQPPTRKAACGEWLKSLSRL